VYTSASHADNVSAERGRLLTAPLNWREAAPAIAAVPVATFAAQLTSSTYPLTISRVVAGSVVAGSVVAGSVDWVGPVEAGGG
jgi:hypothetical protein